MMTTRCECEHSSHFDGGTGHQYHIDQPNIAPTHTVYGTLQMCKVCEDKQHGKIVNGERVQ